MKHFNQILGRLVLVSVIGAVMTIGQTILPAADQDKEPLKLKLPMPTLKGTPDDLPSGPNIEPLPTKPRPPFFIPKGCENVAKGKKVTASDKNPISGEISMVTDGQKEAFDDQVIEMRKGTQWVQVDLEKEYEIHAIVIWHDHRWIQVFRDVVIQISNDPDFTRDVVTVYNNDVDNSSGLGIGKDKEYFETHEGRIIDCKGVRGRYVRAYTRGSNMSALNCIQEIEVYALPSK